MNSRNSSLRLKEIKFNEALEVRRKAVPLSFKELTSIGLVNTLDTVLLNNEQSKPWADSAARMPNFLIYAVC